MEHEHHEPITRGSETHLSLDRLLPTSQSDRIEATVSLGESSSSVGCATNTNIPKAFGRYSIASMLGEGGYGQVFKAFDEQLHRHVAIKVPQLFRLSPGAAIEKYLEEARTLAKMEHPGIVAVHDVGVTEEGLPYIVSAYIDGASLAARMQSHPLTVRHGLELLAKIGDALGYVHAKGIVHRDIKPGNILLNKNDKPFLADFGLALRDENVDFTRTRVGTPAYMSPEQARGESHLVDGRSDIFSLGVVLYEMLTGVRPFRGRDRESTVYALLNRDPSPPRQLNASLPRDLERICLKALAKRASQRYSNAADFVEDLEHLLTSYDAESTSQGSQISANAIQTSGHLSGVIPRGLRSYDRHDASFFCRLLPGIRDRDWVPDSLRFWQRQIENVEGSDPPHVGVIYGPSGCGKSSFVKAGLLPLLSDSVSSVFVEATRDDTELRLLRGIRKRCPDVPPGGSLAQTLAKLRSDYESDGTRRLLIVIDQFEQWLHGRSDEDDPDLATALRQCDGYHVQCLLLIRDDFWLALSRFMAILEVPLKQNHNATLVDLFTTRHARHVLMELGVAYDRLPTEINEFTAEQNLFLDRAAEELSEAGKVFPVRLALFVEMIKTQPWHISTLTHVGGVEGIGLQFLEEAFTSDLAPAAQRTHEPAVRQVLRKLLPDQGIDIKGNMESEQTLLELSGYRDRPEKFHEMMQVLDSDLRLVTPTDPSGTTTNDDSYSQSGDGACYYQLTHDFMVPAIKQWLTRRQRETRKGRAELRLAEYASLWAAKPLPKFAPSWNDWISISFWSSPTHWNALERRMMVTATRRHVLRTIGVIGAAILMTVGISMYRNHIAAIALVQQLQTARAADIHPILQQIRNRGTYPIATLNQFLQTSQQGSRADFINRLGLLTVDPAQLEVLVQRSLALDLPMLMVLRKELSPLSSSSHAFLSSILQSNKEPGAQRLRAAIMMAADKNKASDWPASLIVDEMLTHAKNAPQDHSILVEGLSPIDDALVDLLKAIALSPNDSQTRSLATSFVVAFLKDQPEKLLSFFLDADASQHPAIIPELNDKLPSLSTVLNRIAFAELDDTLSESAYDAVARRKATAAALLHRLGKGDSTWSLLRLSHWPNVRSYLIHRIAPLGGNFESTLARFSREPDVSIRRALLLTLGTFSWDAIPEALQLQALMIAKDAFENDPDVGVHSAAEWALIRWNEKPWLNGTVAALTKSKPDARKQWYVNGEGQTMAVFDAREVPGIGRIFELSTKEVTVDQFQKHFPYHEYYAQRSPTGDCPIGLVNWYSCLDYCRTLSKTLNCDPQACYPTSLNSDNPNENYDEVLDGGAYRLPTAAEWQFACDATTTSTQYYGSSKSLADHYLFHFETSSTEIGDILYSPAGGRKPNDFGMFAMYDGVREWCSDAVGNRRVIMGNHSGQALDLFAHTHKPSASDLPLAINGYYGLRVAKTVVLAK